MSRTHEVLISGFDLDRIESELKSVQKENATLREAARAVIDRWETPLWKDAEPTAKAIYRLRDALEACSGGPHQKYRIGWGA